MLIIKKMKKLRMIALLKMSQIISDKNNENSVEIKLKETEDKLLRSLAEIENQRRRFEKRN